MWSPESCVTAAQCSCARVVHWKAKVAPHLGRCLAATVWAARHHSNLHHSLSPWLRENHTHQCTRAWKHRLKPIYRNMFIRDQWGRQWAEAVSDWNMVSNQQSFIDQATDQWQDCFNACFKVKSKHWTFAMMCFSVTVMTLRRTWLLLWTHWLMFRFTR